MKSAIRWLRASYIAGAVADGLMGILMLIPSRMGETEFRYAMGLGAALMFGWTVLLLWANMKPMERKGILLITIFPTITGLFLTGIWAAANGFFQVGKIVPSSILMVVLILLFGFSYLKARSAERKG
jgi:hypothetical protein